MVYYGISPGEAVEGSCLICKSKTKIYGNTYEGYWYNCVCGIKIQLGKLPKEEKESNFFSNSVYI